MWWTHHNQTYVQGFVLYPIEYCSAALNFSGYRQSLFAVLICDVTICLSIHMHVVLHVMRILSGGINFTDIFLQISNYHSAILQLPSMKETFCIQHAWSLPCVFSALYLCAIVYFIIRDRALNTKMQHILIPARQWPEALKPKSYSLVEGNRTIEDYMHFEIPHIHCTLLRVNSDCIKQLHLNSSHVMWKIKETLLQGKCEFQVNELILHF